MAEVHERAEADPRYRQRRWENPYRIRIEEFPGRIFLLEGDSVERELFSDILTARTPNYVELGSGSGAHLIEYARRERAAHCWGFERRYKRAVRTIEKAKLAGVHNAFVLRTQAERLIELFPAASVSGIFANFPDPWERPKHWKHRLLGPEMLRQAEQVLVSGGFFSAKTDHRDYYDWFLNEALAHSQFAVVEESEDLARSEYAAENIVTEFESLFISQGLPIFYLKLRRR